MSVETRGPYRMPQPEQWMSEHPVVTFLIFAAAFLGVTALGVWL
jgi:hypothetical protein